MQAPLIGMQNPAQQVMPRHTPFSGWLCGAMVWVSPPTTHIILPVGPAVDPPRPRCLTEWNVCAIIRVEAGYSTL